MPRRSFTQLQKLAILDDLESRLANETFRAIARSHNVDPTNLRRWRANREKIQAVRPTSKSVAPGRLSQLEDIEDELLRWYREHRANGAPILYHLMQIKAVSLKPELGTVESSALYFAVRRFCLKHNIVLRRSTHEAQRTVSE